MTWIYHTNISPDDLPKNSFNEAFDIFLNQCIIHKDKINKELSENTCYRFIIKTDIDHDKIMCNDGRFYLKSIFLENKTFKKRLIDYYRPLGIYVKGPNRIDRRDGTSTDRWLIELTPKYKY